MRVFRVLGAVCLVTAGTLVSASLTHAAANMSFGITIGSALPPEATTIRVARETFYVYHGSFYQQVKGGYVLVPAPVGATIKELPRGARKTKFSVGKATYYQHAGVYFKAVRRNFEVCDAPAVKATAKAERDEHLGVKLGDDEFVFRNGRFYLASKDGLLGRSTPVGAVTRDFPPDAMSVWFRDSEYFESSGVFFQETANGFRVVQPPWRETTVAPQEEVAQVSPN